MEAINCISDYIMCSFKISPAENIAFLSHGMFECNLILWRLDVFFNTNYFVVSVVQVKKEPFVPIGCAATAYFLASGIKSFQNQDPRRGQKMMRLRVGAQFATLAIFVFYVGLDNINFQIA